MHKITRKLKSVLLVWTIIVGAPFIASALEGTLQKNIIFKSEILDQTVLYNVYLPSGYDESSGIFPVIFYLHWFGGDNNSANDLITNLDARMARKQFPDAVIIAPNAGICWYLDDYAGTYKYSSMFIREFIPHVNNKYKLTRNPQHRAIMGSSMGGFGALRFTMLNPNQFGICISFMGGMSTKEQIVNDNDEDYVTYHQNLYGDNLKDEDRANDFFINNNPLYIAQQINPVVLKKIKWYIQSCDEDYHSLPNAELHATFHKRGVKHEYRVNDGGHDGSCVESSIEDALDFLRRNLNR